MNSILYFFQFYIIEGVFLVFFVLFFRLKYTRTILYFLNEYKYITLEIFIQLQNCIENFGVMPLKGISSKATTALDELWKIFRKSYIPRELKKFYILQLLYKFFYIMIILHVIIFILLVIIFIFFVAYTYAKK